MSPAACGLARASYSGDHSEPGDAKMRSTPMRRSSLRSASAPLMSPTAVLSVMCRDHLDAAHVGLERRRHIDAAVGALVILHDRDQRAPDCEARAVQRVDKLRLALVVTEARLHAPRLERLEVAARGDLSIGALA